MLTVHTVADLRERVRRWRQSGMTIALVPTMGNLHAGHLALVERAGELAERVVVSIYVNPAQFSPGEDYESYPRTSEADSTQLAVAGVDLVFAPTTKEVYPEGLEAPTTVQVPVLADMLCGKFRPGHFAGVATVVTRLLNMVGPDVAVFGEKDYQQLVIVRRLVRDLAMPVRIIGVATVRAPDGLALSSRNQYLHADERRRAPELHGILEDTADALRQGGESIEQLQVQGMSRLAEAGFRPEYVAIRDAVTLAPLDTPAGDMVILAAAWLGPARLIDNVRLSWPTLSGSGSS